MGFKHAYGNVLRVMGTLDRAQEELGNEGDLTRQFILKMTDAQKNRALIEGLFLSSRMQLKDQYNLINDNCTTVAFRILDSALQVEDQTKPVTVKLRYVLNPIEAPALKALNDRALIDRELQSFNEETGLR